MIKSSSTICYEILFEIRKVSSELNVIPFCCVSIQTLLARSRKKNEGFFESSNRHLVATLSLNQTLSCTTSSST